MAAVRRRFNFDRRDRRTKRVTPALIAAVKVRIVQQLRPKKVVLFGSHASGMAKPGGDVDLLVVLDDNHPLGLLKRRDRFGKLLELFAYRSFGLDAILLTASEVRDLKNRNEGEWDLVLEILELGKTLYADGKETQAERAHTPANARVVS